MPSWADVLNAWVVGVRVEQPASVGQPQSFGVRHVLDEHTLDVVRRAAWANMSANPLEQVNAFRLMEERNALVRLLGASIANQIVDAIEAELAARRGVAPSNDIHNARCLPPGGAAPEQKGKP